MDLIVQSVLYGIIMGTVFDRLAYRGQPFSFVRFLVTTAGYAVAFGILYTLFPPFSMELA